jgi:hypothetical protein
MLSNIGSLLLMTILLAPPAALAADTGRTTFSGIVAAIDPQGGVLFVDEMGPWRTGQGRMVTTRHTLYFTAETKFNTFIRINVPDRFAGDFLEVELDIDSVTPGDFATVECVRHRGRLVAVRVTLAESHHGGNVMTP